MDKQGSAVLIGESKASMHNRDRARPLLKLCLCIGAALFFVPRVFEFPNYGCSQDKAVSASELAQLCPQADALSPSRNDELWQDLIVSHKSDDFRKRAVEWLGGAVRVPTETFDNMGPVGEDERWETRGPFHEYLAQAFPKSHAVLNLTKVNTYGLLYEWMGSDTSLKPLLLMGHMDVVPVNPQTFDQWAHPPFSGYFDGERIWGRGSSDDKSGLIGIMSTVETLLEHDFTPTRTVILSFGFDEEAGGPKGAQFLAREIEKRYGNDSIAMIVDEGSGFAQQYGALIATPGIAEKGSTNVELTVRTPGGHSSVPPAHTGIGILASLLVGLESDPPVPHLERGTPVYETARCLAAHAPDMPAKLRRALVKADKNDKSLEIAEETLFQDTLFRALAGTTQAIDIVNGGVKTNALPEQSTAIINHRIATDSSLSVTWQRYPPVLLPLAAKFNVSLKAFGVPIGPDFPSSNGLIEVDSAGGLEPAPRTPTSEHAAPYELLEGTIKATRKVQEDGREQIFVAPGVMSGNTDTKYYWSLSQHIFRYNHHDQGTGGVGLIHTVNESIALDSFVEMISFFTTLILNADESSAL